jgi:hypothetical protein
MRLRFVVLAVFVAGWPRPAVAQQAFPYKAYIAVNETYVRSGPGESYYPTGKLNAGAQVEVYRHDPGGWYAIRPPEGSFSWIGGRHVKPTGDGLAEVTGERVAVRVGTELTDRRDVVQVRVKRGEVVELKGAPTPVSGRRDATWCKIAPPSGEFRFVHGSDVDLSPASTRPATTAKQSAPAAETAKPADSPGATSATKAAWTPAPAGAASPQPNAVAAAPGSPATATSPGQPTPQTPDAAGRQRTSQEIQKDLDEINSELSIMLAEDPSAWNCEALGQRAKAILDQAQTAVDRGHARMLVNRIAQAEDVKRRHLAANGAPAATARRSGLMPYSGRPGEGTGLSPAGGERFDGVGRLTRVQTPKLGSPRYALVDDQGHVKAYLTPAPGVNVHSYLGFQVGVNGLRGYIPDQNAEHLTARQITVLESRLR